MQVKPGTWYVVTTDSSCTVTDANGKTLCTAVAGEQKPFLATTMEVTLSDEGATVTKSTFNAALALLGQSGEGGNVSSLPGYFAAYFLQDDGNQYLETDVVPTDETGILLDAQPLTDTDTIPMGCREDVSTASRFYAIRPRRINPNNEKILNNGYGWGDWIFFAPQNLGDGEVIREKTLLNWQNVRKAVTPYDSLNLSTLPFTPTLPMYIFAANVAGAASLNYNGRIWRVGISQGNKVVHNYVPAISYDGRPCMVDTMSPSVLVNRGQGECHVGFTLQQARQLGKLPTGTYLDILLPKGWQEDEEVNAALRQAEQNGCEIHIDEYTEASAVTTYSMRRVRQVVWCKIVDRECGSYISVNNERFNIERCVAVYGPKGNDPTAYGYAPFDSVEQAAEEWGLSPAVPTEEELTETE